MCTDAGAAWGFISAVSLFLFLLDRDMYPGTFVFRLHLLLISCKYLLIFFCCSSGKSSIVLVMGDSPPVLLNLAHDDGYSHKPIFSWIPLLNFCAICPVWGILCCCVSCSSEDPGIVADYSDVPAALWSVKGCSERSSRSRALFLLRLEMLVAP